MNRCGLFECNEPVQDDEQFCSESCRAAWEKLVDDWCSPQAA